MNLQINPVSLRGTVKAIPSKSQAHRLLILAALADRPTELGLTLESGDVERTISCLQAMSAGISRSGGAVTVTPLSGKVHKPLLHCGESGSTLRFLLPVAAAVCGGGSFSGEGRLPERPLGGLVAAMKRGGVTFSQDRLPFTITGKLQPGVYKLPGNVSSQYLTGLLLALPGLDGCSAVRITGRLESSAYVAMTLDSLRCFGIEVQAREGRFEIAGNQKYISPGRVCVEGDWSNAAPFLAAGALGGPVTISGLNARSRQGDRAIVPLLERFGARMGASAGSFTADGGEIHGGNVDVSEIPDLLPVLAAFAAAAGVTACFSGAARLRYKESDRIASTAAMINALGGDAVELPEGLAIRSRNLAGGIVDSFGDHRIVMAAALAAIRCTGAVTILNAGAVDKSYHQFFSHYRDLGGEVNGI